MQKESSLGKKQNLNCILAVDLGTTNISVVLLKNGNKVYQENFVNPQIKYGADVLTRIKKCVDGKSEILHKILIDRFKILIQKINEMGFFPHKMIVSANTVMLHILFNCSCISMGYSPFTPSFTQAKYEKNEELGLYIQSFPCISAFGGGDVVAGMLASGMPQNKEKYNILIDLGTNAEIAVWNEKNKIVTSAAAGPCFSAGKMKGTELIDFVANLILHKELDEGGGLVSEKDSFTKTGQRISQKRIREFQLAKAAVRTALDITIENLALNENDIENVYISGGFSEYISIDNAIICGLLPSFLKNKCKAIGNSSLEGAILAANENDLSVFMKNCEYLSLNHTATFNQKFIDNIAFEGVL